jgi:predicted house-cleaning noncanonical NTP pyrophosphatase (MazG superfamily)
MAKPVESVFDLCYFNDKGKSRLSGYMEIIQWVLTIFTFSASHLWKDLPMSTQNFFNTLLSGGEV